jgi:hypothetical protein
LVFGAAAQCVWDGAWTGIELELMRIFEHCDKVTRRTALYLSRQSNLNPVVPVSGPSLPPPTEKPLF